MDHTIAKLYNAKGDISKKWYVYYSFRNPETGLMELVKKRGGINRFKSKKERTKEGLLLASEINLLLENGYNPFTKSIPENNILKDAPLPELIKTLRDNHVKGLRPRSVQGYDDSIKKFTDWLKLNGYQGIRAKDLDRDIYSSIFFGFSDYLMNTLNYAGISHNVCIAHIGIFFNIMKDRKLIQDNPFDKIKNKPIEVGKNVAFSEKQRNELKEALKDNPNLMLYTKVIYSCY